MSNCEEKDSKIETFESRVNKQKKIRVIQMLFEDWKLYVKY